MRGPRRGRLSRHGECGPACQPTWMKPRGVAAWLYVRRGPKCPGSEARSRVAEPVATAAADCEAVVNRLELGLIVGPGGVRA